MTVSVRWESLAALCRTEWPDLFQCGDNAVDIPLPSVADGMGQ